MRTISAAIVIENMLAHGELPALRNCAGCNGHSDEIVDVSAECEKVWSNEPETISWIIGFLLFGMWTLLWDQIREKKEHGTNLILHLPVRLCRTCRGQLIHDAAASALGIGAVTLLVAGVAVMLLWTIWGVILLPGAFFAWWVEQRARKRKQGLIKKVLAQEPIYQELLNDYPDAKVIISVARRRA